MLCAQIDVTLTFSCNNSCQKLLHHIILDPFAVFLSFFLSFFDISFSLKLHLALVSVTELCAGPSPTLGSLLSHLFLWSHFSLEFVLTWRGKEYLAFWIIEIGGHESGTAGGHLPSSVEMSFQQERRKPA